MIQFGRLCVAAGHTAGYATVLWHAAIQERPIATGYGVLFAAAAIHLIVELWMVMRPRQKAEMDD